MAAGAGLRRRLLWRLHIRARPRRLSIADVAGKGLPAALLMSSLQAAVRAFALEASPPHAICASVNRLLCGQMIAGRFATFCYLRLDGRGHRDVTRTPATIRRSWRVAERGRRAADAGGTVLGVFPEAEFSEGETSTLMPAIGCSLYTDGITEARRQPTRSSAKIASRIYSSSIAGSTPRRCIERCSTK